MESKELLQVIHQQQKEFQEEVRVQFVSMNGKFQKIDNQFEKVNGEFQKIDDRFEKVNGEFQKIDDRFEKVNGEFQKIDNQFEKVNGKFQKIDDQFEKVNGRFQKIDDQFKRQEQHQTNLEEKVDILTAQTNNAVKSLLEKMTDIRDNMVDRYEIDFVYEKIQYLEKEIFKLKHE
ncbi:hypothetical protein [Oceanobacillus halophilus]|uniref:t-SNARE coiled-coil homology domain-containing protein n=1 Tax=Oceanobacillus halophilus TaxID=930130 RepID=A0A495A7Z6_9BACI|nr:hypothetical protein [Oceanobacillus halophilus]RKQ35849.1 hypothetical protein D8M06_06235 [Oceanobacillus halophilus]